MLKNLNRDNFKYWQNYKPGEIPSVPIYPPKALLENVDGLVLDVGTGDGVFAEKLSLDGYKVYGIDIAKNIIEKNMKRKSGVEYSVQDITSKTSFPDEYFGLIIFKFTMTNIHKESWQKLWCEVLRILKKGGKIWMLEPLVSESYRARYDLAKNFIDDKNCVYVFKDKTLAAKIRDKSALKKAIKDKKVSRIIKHYTVSELKTVFKRLKLEQSRVVDIKSPSGYMISTFEGVFVKPNSQ